MPEEPRKPTVIEQIHETLFGYVPKNLGTAYERLAAVVLADLGWIDVEHDRIERPAGRLAEHQLDVICRRPDGSVRRLVIECKDWANDVGQKVLVHLVGVRAQIGADAVAIVTRKGFTRGARRVAADEDIALLRL